MSNQLTYNLAKFEDGIVYFIKEKTFASDNVGSGKSDPHNTAEKISAIVNIKELKEHAQYQITVIECETGYKQDYTIHGVYLIPNNILSIAVSHLKRDPSLMSGLERIT
jgi:hypothetical protein